MEACVGCGCSNFEPCGFPKSKCKNCLHFHESNDDQAASNQRTVRKPERKVIVNAPVERDAVMICTDKDCDCDNFVACVYPKNRCKNCKHIHKSSVVSGKISSRISKEDEKFAICPVGTCDCTIYIRKVFPKGSCENCDHDHRKAVKKSKIEVYVVFFLIYRCQDHRFNYQQLRIWPLNV